MLLLSGRDHPTADALPLFPLFPPREAINLHQVACAFMESSYTCLSVPGPYAKTALFQQVSTLTSNDVCPLSPQPDGFVSFVRFGNATAFSPVSNIRLQLNAKHIPVLQHCCKGKTLAYSVIAREIIFNLISRSAK
ncbi:hypothetical protein EVAR_45088_1 [Eumeta japonica]|uniref:Uncharacterized protein n=1 Tax=Eumeta variegata TaxID=151549 RepID=A0A4C1YI71_EUMVA|nr:hypothetical protein EVAR_45088_1 [Eumeta japonica]